MSFLSNMWPGGKKKKTLSRTNTAELEDELRKRKAGKDDETQAIVTQPTIKRSKTLQPEDLEVSSATTELDADW